MKTIGRDRLPKWVKKVIGNRKGIEVKEHNGKYYAYQYKSVWDSKKKMPTRTSTYLGVIKEDSIQPPYSSIPKGIYEYGHIAFVLNILERNGIVKLLKNNFPDWKVILTFAMNRLIDPRPIKSMKSWYEKTYLVKQQVPMSPKTISRVLGSVGRDWNSQLAFFKGIRQNGEKIVYDGSVIFSSSKENSILEIGYNKDELLLTKANIVLAFSHDRYFPIFFRVIPGSIHEIASLDVLLEEIGKDIILVLDKGFMSVKSIEKISKKASFIMPLKRNSRAINYSTKLSSFFMYRNRPIKYSYYRHGRFFIYLYEDLALRYEEEKIYFILLSKGKSVEFKEKWAGKIALISNVEGEPREIYEMWKIRNEVEKSFDILQNLLDTDRPYIRKEDVFRGYIFSSFIGLIAYYLILRKLKEVGINDKVSVSDALLELSKIYVLEIKGREVISEISKRARKLMKTLNIENLITKNGES